MINRKRDLPRQNIVILYTLTIDLSFSLILHFYQSLNWYKISISTKSNDNPREDTKIIRRVDIVLDFTCFPELKPINTLFALDPVYKAVPLCRYNYIFALPYLAVMRTCR